MALLVIDLSPKGPPLATICHRFLCFPSARRVRADDERPRHILTNDGDNLSSFWTGHETQVLLKLSDDLIGHLEKTRVGCGSIVSRRTSASSFREASISLCCARPTSRE